MLQNPGDLDLDDPSSVPSTEGPSNLILPIAMLPSNRAMPNHDETGRYTNSKPLEGGLWQVARGMITRSSRVKLSHLVRL